MENAKLNLLNLCEELDKFESHNEFNIFEATGMQFQEIKHSNFLSYLLDPTNKHELGDEFIRSFLVNSVGQQYKNYNLNNVKVYREKHNIDLLIINDSPDNKEESFLIVVEFKVWSGETGDQLNKYIEVCKKHYPNLIDKAIFLYLTPFGSKPSNSDYEPLSYEVILDSLEPLKPDNNSVAISVEHYKKFIRRYILQNDEKTKEAYDIYFKYKDEIDFINSQSQKFHHLIYDRVSAFISNELSQKWEILEETNTKKNLIHLIPNSSKFLPFLKARNKRWANKTPINFEIDFREGLKVYFDIVIFRGAFEENSVEFMYELLNRSAFQIEDSRIYEKYNLLRLQSIEIPFDENTQESIIQSVNEFLAEYTKNHLEEVVNELAKLQSQLIT